MKHAEPNIIAALLLALAACGGGGSAPITDPPTVVEPSVEILFPPLESRTDTDNCIIRGIVPSLALAAMKLALA